MTDHPTDALRGKPGYWWHEKHSLHSDEHHTHHSPMDACVPLYDRNDIREWFDEYVAPLLGHEPFYTAEEFHGQRVRAEEAEAKLAKIEPVLRAAVALKVINDAYMHRLSQASTAEQLNRVGVQHSRALAKLIDATREAGL